jgi:hypothetical protein
VLQHLTDNQSVKRLRSPRGFQFLDVPDHNFTEFGLGSFGSGRPNINSTIEPALALRERESARPTFAAANLQNLGLGIPR